MTMYADDVTGLAVGTLIGWIDGYTDADSDGVQHKVKILWEAPGRLGVGVEEVPSWRSGRERTFEIEVKVRETTGEPLPRAWPEGSKGGHDGQSD